MNWKPLVLGGAALTALSLMEGRDTSLGQTQLTFEGDFGGDPFSVAALLGADLHSGVQESHVGGFVVLAYTSPHRWSVVSRGPHNGPPRSFDLLRALAIAQAHLQEGAWAVSLRQIFPPESFELGPYHYGTKQLINIGQPPVSHGQVFRETTVQQLWYQADDLTDLRHDRWAAEVAFDTRGDVYLDLVPAASWPPAFVPDRLLSVLKRQHYPEAVALYPATSAAISYAVTSFFKLGMGVNPEYSGLDDDIFLYREKFWRYLYIMTHQEPDSYDQIDISENWLAPELTAIQPDPYVSALLASEIHQSILFDSPSVAEQALISELERTDLGDEWFEDDEIGCHKGSGGLERLAWRDALTYGDMMGRVYRICQGASLEGDFNLWGALLQGDGEVEYAPDWETVAYASPSAYTLGIPALPDETVGPLETDPSSQCRAQEIDLNNREGVVMRSDAGPARQFSPSDAIPLPPPDNQLHADPAWFIDWYQYCLLWQSDARLKAALEERSRVGRSWNWDEELEEVAGPLVGVDERNIFSSHFPAQRIELTDSRSFRSDWAGGWLNPWAIGYLYQRLAGLYQPLGQRDLSAREYEVATSIVDRIALSALEIIDTIYQSRPPLAGGPDTYPGTIIPFQTEAEVGIALTHFVCLDSFTDALGQYIGIGGAELVDRGRTLRFRRFADTVSQESRLEYPRPTPSPAPPPVRNRRDPSVHPATDPFEEIRGGEYDVEDTRPVSEQEMEDILADLESLGIDLTSDDDDENLSGSRQKRVDIGWAVLAGGVLLSLLRRE